jgi:hypothetical protein
MMAGNENISSNAYMEGGSKNTDMFSMRQEVTMLD